MKRLLQSFWGAVYLLCGVSGLVWLWKEQDKEWYMYFLYYAFAFSAWYGVKLIDKSIE